MCCGVWCVSVASLMIAHLYCLGSVLSVWSSVHMNIFGFNPVVVFGTPERRAKALPPLIKGEQKACFAVTEPDAGLDTTKLSTRAVREGASYVVHGRTIWISTAQVADKMLLLARTTPLSAVKNPTQGPSLFSPSPDRTKIEMRKTEKMSRKPTKTKK